MNKSTDTPSNRMAAVRKVVEFEGFDDVPEFLDRYGTEAVVPGICVNPSCAEQRNLEPDGDYECSECGHRMASVLRLLELI